jgi:hypothetical protein
MNNYSSLQDFPNSTLGHYWFNIILYPFEQSFSGNRLAEGHNGAQLFESLSMFLGEEHPGIAAKDRSCNVFLASQNYEILESFRVFQGWLSAIP